MAPLQTSDEAAVRKVIEDWAAAVRRKDYTAILRHHAPELLMFDVPPPLRADGLDEYRRTWELFFAWSPDPPAFEIREMRVTAGADVAFAAALMRCQTREAEKATTFQPLDFRVTIGLRKHDGQWTIEHEHHSIPATP